MKKNGFDLYPKIVREHCEAQVVVPALPSGDGFDPGTTYEVSCLPMEGIGDEVGAAGPVRVEDGALRFTARFGP